MSTNQRTVQDWVQHIARAELPSFGQTLQQIAALNEFMVSHAAELTRVVLRDPAMTAKILRLANTAHFNPTQRRVNTVSRAVIVLGFQTLRSICVAALLLDELLARAPGDELSREVADAFHAALQARELAIVRREANVEEIFIAALLYRIGELAFWACGGESATAVREQQRAGKRPTEAEEAALGFRLRTLTQGLAQEWKVSETLITALRNPKDSSAAACVAGAHDVVRQLREARAASFTPEQLAFYGRPEQELQEHVASATEQTLETLKACGAEALLALVRPGESTAPAPETAALHSGEPDAELQLAIVRELTQMAMSKVDINLVLQLVLEALHRGAGMRRVLIALSNQTRTDVVAKYVVESQETGLLGKFRFRLGDAPVLQTVLNEAGVLWGWRDGDKHGFGVVLKQTGAADCFIGPLTVKGKVIGVIYADRLDQAMTATDMDAFELFVGQAMMCLQAQTAARNGA